jgi:hypothetical protein
MKIKLGFVSRYLEKNSKYYVALIITYINDTETKVITYNDDASACSLLYMTLDQYQALLTKNGATSIYQESTFPYSMYSCFDTKISANTAINTIMDDFIKIQKRVLEPMNGSLINGYNSSLPSTALQEDSSHYTVKNSQFFTSKISENDFSQVTNLSYFFDGSKANIIEELNMNASDKVTSIKYMFRDCYFS